MPTIFLFLFFHLQEHINPTILMGAKQWVKLFLHFCFLSLPGLITIVPLSNLIIVNIIVIILYIYLFLCYKPITDKLQRKGVIPHCLITYFLCFKVIRDIFQLPWVDFNGLFAHLLSFKIVSDLMKCIWYDTHLHPETISNII